MLASAAGLTVARAEPDVTGDDFTIGHKGVVGNIRHPKIDVQVKSGSRPGADCKDGHWKYRMQAKHFNELAGTDFVLPRFLVLVIVPGHSADYATASHDVLVLKHAAFWLSLEDRQPVNRAPDTKVPVDVPIDNLLTVDVLRTLMAPADSARTGA